MALTQQEWHTQRVEAFHDELRGHRRAPWWPDVPKTQVDLGVCATPTTHEWTAPITVPLDGRPYQIDLTVCAKCPAHLTTLVLPEQDTTRPATKKTGGTHGKR